MITVHHLEQSRSQRILWLLEELKLPYDVRHYSRDPETSLAPPALRKIHPLGKSPVITDGDVTLAETGAIVEYLIEHHGTHTMKPPTGTKEALDYLYWIHFAEGTAMPPLLMSLVMTRIAEAPMPFFAKPIAKRLSARVMDMLVNPNIKSQFDLIESTLSQSKFFAGDTITGADIMMSFPLEAAASRANATESRPNLKNWLNRIHARPGYQAALKKGGPYIYGPVAA